MRKRGGGAEIIRTSLNRSPRDINGFKITPLPQASSVSPPPQTVTVEQVINLAKVGNQVTQKFKTSRLNELKTHINSYFENLG